MAITVTPQILGQEATSIVTYAYLHEPLRVSIEENDLTATKIYINLEVYESDTGALIDSRLNYGDYDINQGSAISVDLMKLVNQYHNSGVYKYSNINEIAGVNGWYSIVSRYKFTFKIYSDKTAVGSADISKLPLIGGRSFSNFQPTVNENQIINEFDLFGVSSEDSDFIGWPKLNVDLELANQADSTPSVTVETPVSGRELCIGYVIWKSRLGGWMQWGFDIQNKKPIKRYIGKLEVGMFESTEDTNGNPYVPVDYTSIETSYTINLKSLSLSSEQLEAVSSIETSPAVYYMLNQSGDIELMRVTSVNAPLRSEANGGDFSITLNSISRTSQTTI